MERLITLGASNLTRGFSTLLNTARAVWGEPIEVFGALGHGRSYGIRSRVLMRTLPGILESGLWAELASRPQLASRALITDVGNDILYDVPVATILDWVAECVRRLRLLGSDVIVTDMPLVSVRGLSPARFKFFRSLFVPSCRLSQGEVTDRSVALGDGLVSLAREGGLTLVRLRPEWYGFDPIHIRPRFWGTAWREILLGGRSNGAPVSQGRRGFSSLGLYLARPHRRWIFGVEQRCRQPAIRAAQGTTVWLY